MAPRKKTQTKEEILQKKRDAEWKKYERLNDDPQRREELREKGHLKYLKKEKEKGTRKLVKDMTPRGYREAKKKWREHCSAYRNKKKALTNITNTYLRENTPDSGTSHSSRPITPQDVDMFKKGINREKKLRYQIKKKKNDKIKLLKRKLLEYIKCVSRLMKKERKMCKDTN
ncbi:unnamed protein product [Acanthoscelides obtectus]|uniref:Uncharacterized protein n=1 Tax=Acanthoscelides obtectus TaxID=200917 RepID=A0A9P0L796_ACAOB|nr:unnamed protein product [Acanthoscelides obtectus]CAK1671757.1 hypothetical protein AOBTE_LOCUS28439 [Acanthoscelides obtectus]